MSTMIKLDTGRQGPGDRGMKFPTWLRLMAWAVLIAVVLMDAVILSKL